MALTPTHSVTPGQLRRLSASEMLTRIDAAERESLARNPAPLTADPYLLERDPSNAYSAAKPRTSHAPLRLIKPAHDHAVCGFGSCALTPECTRKCRYLEAHQAIVSSTGPGHAQRATMPAPKVDHQLRRVVVIGLLVYGASCVGFATWWLLT